MPLVPLQLGDKEGVQRCIKSMQLFDELQKRMRENFDGDLHCFWQYSELEPQAPVAAEASPAVAARIDRMLTS